jgi:hypothetical protein
MPMMNQSMGQMPMMDQTMGQMPMMDQTMGQMPMMNQSMGQMPMDNGMFNINNMNGLPPLMGGNNKRYKFKKTKKTKEDNFFF